MDAWVRTIEVPVDGGALTGDLAAPEGAVGVVAFAHGSGSSRRSPRNRHVAQGLRAVGLATLLVDLLTETEGRDDERTGAWRFDVALLGERMVAVVDALAALPQAAAWPVGLFGASTGAAAALVAAARRPDVVRAVVSRGGRPDLAGASLRDVRAPVLLVVGGADGLVLDLNRAALADLPASARLAVVPGAGHLFEGPGELDAVVALAATFFAEGLGRAGP